MYRITAALRQHQSPRSYECSDSHAQRQLQARRRSHRWRLQKHESVHRVRFLLPAGPYRYTEPHATASPHGDAAESEALALKTVLAWAAEKPPDSTAYFFTDAKALVTALKYNRFVTTLHKDCHAAILAAPFPLLLAHCTKIKGSLAAHAAARKELKTIATTAAGGASLIQHKHYVRLLRDATAHSKNPLTISPTLPGAAKLLHDLPGKQMD